MKLRLQSQQADAKLDSYKRTGNCLSPVTVYAIFEGLDDTQEDTEKIEVETYAWVSKDDPSIYGEWDFKGWRLLHADEFVETFRNVLDWNMNSNRKRREDA